VTLRRARTSDVRGVADLVDLYASDHILLVKERVTLYEDVQEFRVAEAGGAVVAWAGLIPQGEVCVLDDLWVDPAWIGRGVGTQLFGRSVERARALGALGQSHLIWPAARHQSRVP
jgi:amino-acid N-acetyltransferase